MTKQLTKPETSIRQLFESAGVQGQLKRAAASMVEMDQLVRVVLTVIRTNAKLQECSQQSLLACLFGCAQLGLSPEPYLGQCYLVPFWSSKLKCNEAVFMPGYRGYITLARRSGDLENLSAQMVYRNDEFYVQYGLRDRLEHIPADGDRGDRKGAWTVFRYRDGGQPTFDYMTIANVDRIKEMTKARNRQGEIVGPWIDHYDEMAKKTVIRRHMKLAPLSIEETRLAKAVHAENLALEGTQSGFFLPEPEPIEIDAKSADISGVFAFATRDISNDPLFEQWLNVCSESNEMPIEQVKSEAMKDIEGFKRHFSVWKKTQQKEPDKPTDTWGIFRAKWINLKKGFEDFMAEPKNQQLFRLAKDERPDLYNEGRNKYINKIGKTWPLDSETVVDIPPKEQPEPEIKDIAKPEADEPIPSGPVTGEDKGEEEKDDPIASNNVKDIYQSKEWQELAMLKEKYPAEYTSVVKEDKVKVYLEGFQVKHKDKIEWITEAISRIDAKVDVNGEGAGEIPNGEQKF